MMKRFLLPFEHFVILVALVLITACRHPAPAIPEALPSWTVLIYMAADADDLREPAFSDLRELQAVFGPNIPNVWVHLDLNQPEGHYVIQFPNRDAPLGPGALADLGLGLSETHPEHEAPEDDLTAFLEWGMMQAPATHYAVVLWGHGRGWRPADAPQPVKMAHGGFGFDQSERTVLDVPALKRAFRAASDRPFDLYIFDACLMQSLEVLVELADVATYAIGSEQIEAYQGLPYHELLTLMADPPTSDTCPADDVPCAIASMIPSLGSDEHRDKHRARSAVRLSKLENLITARDELGVALQAFVSADPFRAVDLQALLDRRTLPAFLGGYRDMGSFLEQLVTLAKTAQAQAASESNAMHTAEAVAVRAMALRTAVEEAVLAASFGSTYDADRIASMLGVSMWLPSSPEELTQRRSFFETAALYRGPAPHPWWAWLRKAFFPRAP